MTSTPTPGPPSQHDSLALLGSDDLVTGEAVALDLPPATIGLRVVSGGLDVLAQGLILFTVVVVGAVVTSGSDAALLAVSTVVTAVVALVVFPTAIETLTRGRSLGKLATGLRTVRDDAGPIGFRHAFARALVGVVEIWVLSGVPTLVSALVTRRGQRLGDLVAGTYVVRDRFAFPVMRPVVMPPQLAGWAERADIAPLPDGLAMAVRQFLERAPTLNPGSRARLADSLNRQALAHVAPPPPGNEHPETVLAAVLAERRRRDTARLVREDALRRRLRQT